MTNNYSKIDDFLKDYKGSSYRQKSKAIELFLLLHNINPETYLKDIRLLEIKQQIQIKDNYAKDIKEYLRFLQEENYSPSTVKNYISSIRQLLENSHILLDDNHWKQINKIKTGNGKTLHDIAPNKEQIKLILSNANAMERAFILTMITTGKRPIEILSIDKDDLKLDETPPRIKFKITNTDTKRRTPYSYITEECKDAIKAYMTQRDRYLEYVKKISNLPIKTQYNNRLFPLSDNTIRRRYNNLLKKSGLDEDDKNSKGSKLHIYHLNTIRKFFRSYLGNRDLAEYLMGHTNINNLYWNKPQEDIKKDYLKYEQNLYIYADNKLNDNIQELREELKDLKETFNYLGLAKFNENILQKNIGNDYYTTLSTNQKDNIDSVWIKTKDGRFKKVRQPS